MAQPPPPVTTYRQFYSDPSNDPYPNYTDLLEAFVIDPANTQQSPQPAATLASITTSASAGDPNALLVLHADDDQNPGATVGHIRCYHRVTKYSTRLGMPPTQWDDLAFAFSGDYINTEPPQTVKVPTNYLHLAAQVRVPSPAAIDQFFANNPDAQSLGPFTANDADTEIVRVRHSVLLPPVYVPLILEDTMTPRAAWERIRGEMVNQNRSVECRAVVDWLRVALTKRNNNENISELVSAKPTVPLLDTTLANHRHHLLMLDLPGRNLPVNHGADAQLINNSLGQLTTVIRDGQLADAARADAKSNKTVQDYFKSETQNLINVCQVRDEEQLPPVYLALAKASNKREERRILQSHIDQARVAINRHLQFTVTTEFYTMVSMLAFRMLDIDNFTSGFQPFLFCQHNPKDEEAALQSAAIHDAVYSDHARPTMSEIAAMVKASSVSDASILPPSHMHGINMLLKMQIASYVLLGPNHASQTIIKRFIESWQIYAIHMQSRDSVLDNHRSFHLPAMVVRYFQVKFAVWLERQWDSDGIIPMPYFNDLFDKEAERDYSGWEKPLPGKYLVPKKSVAPLPVPAGPAVPPGNGGANPAAVGVDRTRVVNPNPVKACFSPYANMPNIRIGKILQHNNRAAWNALPPAPTDQSSKMCPSYHIKGQCANNCGRKADHVAHTDEQDQLLVAWCTEYYRAISAEN